MDQGNSLDIAALSDEASQQAARILQERRLKSNPVRAAVARQQCQDGVDGIYYIVNVVASQHYKHLLMFLIINTIATIITIVGAEAAELSV